MIEAYKNFSLTQDSKPVEWVLGKIRKEDKEQCVVMPAMVMIPAKSKFSSEMIAVRNAFILIPVWKPCRKKILDRKLIRLKRNMLKLISRKKRPMIERR